MLSNSERINISKITTYLLSVRDEYQSELYSIENDIIRVTGLLEEAENNKESVESTFDNTYMVLSSSQVAKSNEFAEIDSLEELIELKKIELDSLNNKKRKVLDKIMEVEEVISCAKAMEEV